MGNPLARGMRPFRLAMLAGFLAASLAGCAQRPAPPPPTVIEPARLPWTAAVGKLDVDGARSCTAILVKPDVILTASHCLHQQPRPADPASLQFRPNFGAVPDLASATGSVVHAQGGAIREGHLETPEQVAADWVLIGISPAITGVAPIPLARLAADEILRKIAGGAKLFTAGYGYGAMKSLRQHSNCHIVGPTTAQQIYNTGMLVTTCIIRIGDSGGPMVLLDPAGKPSLIGIFAGFGLNTKTGLSYAVNAGRIAPYLGDALVSALLVAEAAVQGQEQVYFPVATVRGTRR